MVSRVKPVRCPYCGRWKRYAWIVNRGPVMAHAKGDGEACRRLIATGRDMVSRAEQEAARKAAQEAARAAYQERRKARENP